MSKQFTVITKDGSKWLRTPSPYNPKTEPASTRWFHEEKCPDLPYIGSRPDGTTVDESEVTAITQARNKEYSSSNWFSISENDADWNDFELRTVYTDAESHRHISDDYWKRRCEAAENYINESPSDPDITRAQKAAYEAWQEIIKQEPK